MREHNITANIADDVLEALVDHLAEAIAAVVLQEPDEPPGRGEACKGKDRPVLRVGKGAGQHGA